MSAPVLIMAGGTGGHIFPGLAVAAALRARGVPVAWLGSQQGLEGRLVPAQDIPLTAISISGLRGKGALALLGAPLKILRAVLQSIRALRTLKPRCAISFGGYAAGPGGVAAWLLRCPLLVHEQNTVPGVTNRLLAKLARQVLSGFPDALPGARWVGNPVRASIAQLATPEQRFAGRGGALRLLVLGGSQGARSLNQAVPSALVSLNSALGAGVEVRHQSGPSQLEITRSAYAGLGDAASVSAFIEKMDEAYAWADLVICRSGALTVAELAAAGIGSLLVPFPHAVDDHQTSNARWLVDANAARLLPEGPQLSEQLAACIAELAGQRQRLLQMAQAARGLARVDAAEQVADACLAEARS